MNSPKPSQAEAPSETTSERKAVTEMEKYRRRRAITKAAAELTESEQRNFLT